MTHMGFVLGFHPMLFQDFQTPVWSGEFELKQVENREQTVCDYLNILILIDEKRCRWASGIDMLYLPTGNKDVCLPIVLVRYYSQKLIKKIRSEELRWDSCQDWSQIIRNTKKEEFRWDIGSLIILCTSPASECGPCEAVCLSTISIWLREDDHVYTEAN